MALYLRKVMSSISAPSFGLSVEYGYAILESKWNEYKSFK
jgi:hypothetical protein